MNIFALRKCLAKILRAKHMSCILSWKIKFDMDITFISF
jgi:hypothetical protein